MPGTIQNLILIRLAGSFLLLFLNSAQSQSVYSCTSQKSVNKVNLADCSGSLLCHNDYRFGDIAYEGGVLYGCFTPDDFSFSTALCKIDTVTGIETVIATIENQTFNGLVGDGEGHLYAAGSDTIFRFDLETGLFTGLGTAGHRCLGDLAFMNGTLYMTSLTNEAELLLIKINTNPFSYDVVGILDLGSNVYGGNYTYGLISVPVDGRQILYATSTDCGDMNYLYRVDETTANTTLVCTGGMGMNGGYAWGLATATKNTAGIAGVAGGMSVSVYPNPAATGLFIQCTDPGVGRCRLSLTTLQGKEVLSGDIAFPGTGRLDVSSVENGIYLLALTGDRGSFTSKIVVRK